MDRERVCLLQLYFNFNNLLLISIQALLQQIQRINMSLSHISSMNSVNQSSLSVANDSTKLQCGDFFSDFNHNKFDQKDTVLLPFDTVENLTKCSVISPENMDSPAVEKAKRSKLSQQLAILKTKNVPGTVTKRLFDQSTVFSGTLPGLDLKHTGNLVHPDSSVYHGEVLNYVENGHGTMKYGCNSTYTGDWKNGQRCGFGTQINAGGSTWVGNFLDDMVHGDAKFTSADGKITFEGHYEKNEMHGSGRLSIVGDSTYEGNFVHDLKHGKGRESYAASGDVYVGDFEHNHRHGYGVYTWSAAASATSTTAEDSVFLATPQYVGAWSQGKMDGYGVLTFDGGAYSGMFKNNMFHGVGRLEYSSGGTESGVWLKGIKLTPQELNVYNDTLL